jgi:hypothetical protein
MSDQTDDFGLEPGESFEPHEIDDVFAFGERRVSTALGPIDPGALGFTLLAFDEDAIDPATRVTILEDASHAGLQGLIRLNPVTADTIRDALWIAQRSPVHLVLSESAEHGHSGSGLDEWTGAISAAVRHAEHSGLDEPTRSARIAAQESGKPVVVLRDSRSMAGTTLPSLVEMPSGLCAVLVMPAARLELDGIGPFLGAGRYVCVSGSVREDGIDQLARAIAAFVHAGYEGQVLAAIEGAFENWASDATHEPALRRAVERLPLALMQVGLDAGTVRRLLVENPAEAFGFTPPV